MGELFRLIAQEEPERRNAAMGYLFQRKARAMKAPIGVQFEIIPFCTLKCKMCYVVEDNVEFRNQMLSGNDWIDLIRQSSEMGVFNLTLSGGECTLHPQFREIYAAAYDLGMDVTIISNGTLIDDGLIDFFYERPPKKICITMYGFSNDTYEVTCGNRYAFEKVKKAVIAMKKKGLPVLVQSTVTVDMFQDVPEIARFAHEWDIPFVYSTKLKANRKCELDTILKVSVSEENEAWINQKIFEYTGRKRNLPSLCEMIDPEEKRTHGTDCGAGNSMFHINWRGEMTPCVTFDPIFAYPLQTGVEDAWHVIRDYCEQLPKKKECRQCHFFARCMHCIAMHWGDTDRFDIPAPRLCWKVQHPEQAAREEAEYLAMKQQSSKA